MKTVDLSPEISAEERSVHQLAGVSVVIPCHGRVQLLPEVLAPILSDPSTQEAIVVADRDEQVARAARDIGHPLIRVVEIDAGDENAARQAGVEAATGDVVLLLDNDVVLAPGVVSGHLASHDPDSPRVVAGYMPLAAASFENAAFPVRVYSYNYELGVSRWRADPQRVLLALWAGNLSLRKADALRIGVFDSNFRGMYFQDNDFGLRCLAGGMTGVFNETLTAGHHMQRSVPDWIVEAKRQGASLRVRGLALRGGVTGFLGRPRIAPLASRALLSLTIAAGRLGWMYGERYFAWVLSGVLAHVGGQAVDAGTATEQRLLRPVRAQ